MPASPGWRSTFVQLPGLSSLHVVTAGPEAGPPVVLLHGFPDFHFGWRHQIAPLAQSGYRVIAPDQRGYNLSLKTPPFDLLTVTADLLHLLDALGLDRVRLVGHDWGGAVAWLFAALHPHRLERLAVLNLPHPLAMEQRLARPDPAQYLRSWYFAFFQLPRLPEWVLRARDFVVMRAGLAASAHLGAFTRDDLAQYARAWSQPGALSAMLGWYRAVWVSRRQVAIHHARLARLEPPALLLWGERDGALVPALAEDSARYLLNGRVITLPHATHWLHLEDPATVNHHLLAHLA